MEEKAREAGLPAVFVSGAEMSTSAVAKTRSYKKYAIIAVCSIATIAIILAAILVGMYLFSESQKDIVKLSFSWDKDTKTEVSADSDTNIVQYHVTGRSYEAWVVDDFNRDIRVLKVQKDSSGTNCYAIPLNRTQAADPAQIDALSKDYGLKKNATVELSYETASTPILDVTFTSKTARKMCDGISTYWLYPKCEASKPAGDGLLRREKRRAPPDMIIITPDAIYFIYFV